MAKRTTQKCNTLSALAWGLLDVTAVSENYSAQTRENGWFSSLNWHYIRLIGVVRATVPPMAECDKLAPAIYSAGLFEA